MFGERLDADRRTRHRLTRAADESCQPSNSVMPTTARVVPEPKGNRQVAGTRYEFAAVLWRWAARTEQWVFLRLPDDVSAEIADVPRPRAGFGAIKVSVTIGGSRWRTSIFPERTGGPYVLPVKKAVRTAEGLDVGDVARVGLETLDGGG